VATTSDFDFVPVREASRLIGKSRSALYTAASRRRIRSYHFGRSLYFKRSELLAHFVPR
jgi:excisionase family DNA binding protein